MRVGTVILIAGPFVVTSAEPPPLRRPGREGERQRERERERERERVSEAECSCVAGVRARGRESEARDPVSVLRWLGVRGDHQRLEFYPPGESGSAHGQFFPSHSLKISLCLFLLYSLRPLLLGRM